MAVLRLMCGVENIIVNAIRVLQEMANTFEMLQDDYAMRETQRTAATRCIPRIDRVSE